MGATATTMTSGTSPGRLQQQMEALGRANAVRTKRAAAQTRPQRRPTADRGGAEPPARVPGKRDDPRPADLDAETQADEGQPGAAALPDLAEPDRRRADRTPAAGDHRRTGATRARERRTQLCSWPSPPPACCRAALQRSRRARRAPPATRQPPQDEPAPGSPTAPPQRTPCRRCQRQAPATTAARASSRNPTHVVAPGALNPAVTQANIEQTICRPGGYTASVRPPETRDRAREARADGRCVRNCSGRASTSHRGDCGRGDVSSPQAATSS